MFIFDVHCLTKNFTDLYEIFNSYTYKTYEINRNQISESKTIYIYNYFEFSKKRALNEGLNAILSNLQ